MFPVRPRNEIVVLVETAQLRFDAERAWRNQMPVDGGDYSPALQGRWCWVWDVDDRTVTLVEMTELERARLADELQSQDGPV